MILDTTHAIGWKANDFALQGIDGKTYSLAEVRGPKGTLVVFICNHCPYVKASISRIVTEAKALREIGIGTIAIMPNDSEAYPRGLLRQHEGIRSAAWIHLSLRYRYDPGSGMRLWRAMHARFLRLQHRDELQYRGRLQRFHLIEQPIDGNCSFGPCPVSAICFMASNRSRRALAMGVIREASFERSEYPFRATQQ